MTRKIWSEVELSAYLDGELDASTSEALETAVKYDLDLRQRLQALEQTVAWVRAVPMREAPKNYLLTPSMVTEKSPAKPRRRRGLVWMRVATSLTGLACVISLGLNLLNSASLRTMTTQAPPAPEAKIMLESEPAAEKRAVPEVASEDAADVERPEEPKTLSPEEEMALSPASPAEAPAGAMGENIEGVGGGAEPVESEPAPMMQMTVVEEAEPQAASNEEQAAPDEEVAPLELEMPEAENLAADTVITEAPAPSQQTLAYGEPTPPEAFPPRWITGMLGIITLVLAAITYWLSRHA